MLIGPQKVSKNRHFVRGRKGFTLMELVIVVVIIAILAAIGLPHYFRAIRKAKIGKPRGNLGEIRKVQLAFEAVTGSWIVMPLSQTVSLQVDLDDAEQDNDHTTGTDIRLSFFDRDYTYVRAGDVVIAAPVNAASGLPTNTLNLRTGVANW